MFLSVPRETLLAAAGTIVLIAALVWYTSAPTARERRERALEAAAAAENLVPTPFRLGATARDLELLALAADDQMIAKGENAFATHCLLCHGPDTQSAYPERSELFDGIWYRGSTPAEIEQTAHLGYPPTGMVGWKGIVPDEQLTAAVAYLVAQQLEREEGPPEG